MYTKRMSPLDTLVNIVAGIVVVIAAVLELLVLGIVRSLRARWAQVRLRRRQSRPVRRTAGARLVEPVSTST